MDNRKKPWKREKTKTQTSLPQYDNKEEIMITHDILKQIKSKTQSNFYISE